MGADNSNGSERAFATLWEHMLAALRRAQHLRFSLQVIFTLGGGAIAGVAQFLADSADAAVKAQWHWLGAIGVGMVAVGGASLLLLDKPFIKLMDEAREAIEGWKSSQLAIAGHLDQIEFLDRQLHAEEDRNVAFDIIIQFLDQSLASTEVIEKRLQSFISLAGPRVVDLLNLLSNQDFTVSVFLPKIIGAELRLARVASYWKEREKQKKDKRAWPKGIGWTGEAWRRALERHLSPWVIEEDAACEDSKAKYNTLNFERDGDYDRFRSVIAVPFRVADDAVGVVTVTVGRAGTFSRTIESSGGKNAAMVRTFTKIVSALVASGHKGSHTPDFKRAA